MRLLRSTLLFAIGGLALGCGATVTPSTPTPDAGTVPDVISTPDAGMPSPDIAIPFDIPRPDAGAPDVPAPTDLGPREDVRPAVDAPFSCMLPGGGTCMEGQSCRHPDGCNTCTCRDRNPLAACTLLGCISDGGPALSCRGHADCRTGEECRFDTPGCDVLGTCRPITDRDCEGLQPYCGCDGVSYRDCPGGTGHPWASLGLCPGDGGAPTDGPTPTDALIDATPAADAAACEGAFISRDYVCMGGDGRAVPSACCRDWPCDTRAVFCATIPPVCPSGEVPIARSGCYGACVPATRCAPMSCRERPCPSGWSCDMDTGACRFAR